MRQRQAPHWGNDRRRGKEGRFLLGADRCGRRADLEVSRIHETDVGDDPLLVRVQRERLIAQAQRGFRLDELQLRVRHDGDPRLVVEQIPAGQARAARPDIAEEIFRVLRRRVDQTAAGEIVVEAAVLPVG